MSETELRELIKPCLKLAGGIIHACHAVMDSIGYIDRDSKRIIADVFNLSIAEVSGIVSFYHDFKTEPQPPKQLRICMAEACQANQARKLVAAIEQNLHTKIPCHTANGETAIGFTYCLGICPNGPAVTIDGKLLANASATEVLANL
ncbi:MAG: NADH-quinone oxidoreductase subunit E [Gammaproteobacteria bacterium]|nr:NADH-quinone oxidoreductase subunit E [Gammaproteobacteria bacterium]